MAALFPVFAVPMASAVLPISDQVNAEIRDLLLTSADARNANKRASMEIDPLLYESEFNLFSWPNEPIVRLRDACWRFLGDFLTDINGFSVEELSKIEIQSHTWFHITQSGGRFGLHNHPMASWSGVYCVDDGQPDPAVPNNGVLRIHHPMPMSNMYLDAGNYRIKPPFAMQPFDLNLRAKDIVLFPSWLMHEVTPFFGARKRITIAFNCWFKARA
jgi:uncharacterized protein (TIGR02466 family)